MIDPKTRTIRCTYYFSNEEDDRCLTEATRFFRISGRGMSTRVAYDAKCEVHYKIVAVISKQNSDFVEEIDRETFIVEPVHES